MEDGSFWRSYLGETRAGVDQQQTVRKNCPALQTWPFKEEWEANGDQDHLQVWKTIILWNKGAEKHTVQALYFSLLEFVMSFKIIQ